MATLTAVDPEGESIVWSLDDDDNDALDGNEELFDIENGVLTFKSAPDYETGRPMAAPDNTYVVTVQASDGGNDTTATETLTIRGHQRGGARYGDAVHVAAPGEFANHALP